MVHKFSEATLLQFDCHYCKNVTETDEEAAFCLSTFDYSSFKFAAFSREALAECAELPILDTHPLICALIHGLRTLIK
jgi:hypothetical protein